MAQADLPPLPAEEPSAEVLLAQGIREQLVVSQGQLEQLTTVNRLLGSQNAQSSIIRYDGNPKQFREWTRSLEKYSLLIGANPESLKQYALQSAEGPVSDFLIRHYKHNPTCSWGEIYAELKARFGDIVDSQHGLQVLRTCKQKPDQTIQVYAEYMLGLAELAWPNDPLTTPLIQRQILDVFVDGLTDNQIARKVLRDNPVTVADAVRIAVEEQNLAKKFNLRNRGFVKPQVQVKPPRVPKASSYRQEEPMDVDTFQGRCYKCNKRGHRAADCYSKKVHAVQSRLVCYKCGEAGHGISTCQNRGKPSTGRCWCCGAKDHIQVNCPSRPKTAKQNQTNAGITENEENWNTSA